MSFSPRPARFSAFSTAGTGPMPMRAGCTPATPQLTSRPSGFSRSASAFSRLATMQAAAASFCPLALPAVTVAAGSDLARIGRSAASFSRFASARGCSSRSNTVSPLRSLTRTGTISCAKTPEVLRRDGLGVRSSGELVLLGTGDLKLAPQVLRGFDHAARHRIEFAARKSRGHAPCGTSVPRRRRAGPSAAPARNIPPGSCSRRRQQ